MKYTPEYIEEIRQKLEAYIEAEDIPVVAEFAYKNRIPRQQLYVFPALSDTIKRLIDKKEANLEKLGLMGKIDKTMAIFSLKQLGWKDVHHMKHSLDFDDVKWERVGIAQIERILAGEDPEAVLTEEQRN